MLFSMNICVSSYNCASLKISLTWTVLINFVLNHLKIYVIIINLKITHSIRVLDLKSYKILSLLTYWFQFIEFETKHLALMLLQQCCNLHNMSAITSLSYTIKLSVDNMLAMYISIYCPAVSRHIFLKFHVFKSEAFL